MTFKETIFVYSGNQINTLWDMLRTNFYSNKENGIIHTLEIVLLRTVTIKRPPPVQHLGWNVEAERYFNCKFGRSAGCREPWGVRWLTDFRNLENVKTFLSRASGNINTGGGGFWIKKINQAYKHEIFDNNITISGGCPDSLVTIQIRQRAKWQGNLVLSPGKARECAFH